MAINLGDINFGLGPDTRRLTAARAEVLKFGQAVNRAAADQSDGARAVEAAMRRQEKAIVTTLNQILKLNDAIRKSGANPTYLNSTTTQFNRLVKELAAGQVSALQFQRSMEEVSTTVGRTNRALDAHRQAQAQVAAATKLASKAFQDEQAYMISVERTMFNASQNVTKFNAAVSRSRAPAALSSGANGALGAFQSAMSGGTKSPLEIQRASQVFQAAMTKNKLALQEFNKVGEQSRAAEMLSRLASVSVLLNGPMSGIATRLTLIGSVADKVSLSTAAMVTGIAAGAYAFVKLGESAINSVKVFQRVELALDSLNDSSKLTATQVEYLMNVSDRSGAAFSSLGKQFTSLEAASVGTNLEGERTRKIFEQIVFSGAKLGLSNEDVAGSLVAVQQIMSKGVVQAEELRGQLGDRMPGAFKTMADALHLSTAELSKMMKQGKITSDALVPFAELLAKKLGVDVNEAIGTVVSSEGRAQNAFLRFGKSMDDVVGFSKAYQTTLEAVANGLDSLGSNLGTIIPLVGLLAGALLGLYTPALLSGFATLVGLIVDAGAAMWAFTAATLANPIGGIGALLLRLGLAAAGAVVGFKALEAFMKGESLSATEKLNKGFEDTNTALWGAAGASATFRKELEAQILIQKASTTAALAEADAQLAAAKARLTAQTAEHEKNPWNLINAWQLGDTKRDVSSKFNTSMDLDAQLSKLDIQAATIAAIRKKLGEQDGDLNIFGSGNGTGAGSIDKAAKAIREANQLIGETGQQYHTLMSDPSQQEWLRIQDGINKKIQDFKDKLVDAKVPAETVAMLTGQFAANLHLLDEAAYNLKVFPDLFRDLADVLQGSLDQGMSQFLDALFAGQDAMIALGDIGKMVVNNLIKEFATLAVLNPLKNLLGGDTQSGSPFPTFNPLSFITGLFGGGGGGGGGFDPIGNGAGVNFSDIAGFAGGGSFQVGGDSGGIDEQLVQFKATRGETVNVSKSGHGSNSDGSSGIGDNHLHFDLRGANGNAEIEAAVNRGIKNAMTMMAKTDQSRTQQTLLRGRLLRKPGMS